MTRATKSPVNRIVLGPRGREMVVRVEGHSLTMRPLYHRRGGEAEVTVKWETMYERALYLRARPLPKARRR